MRQDADSDSFETWEKLVRACEGLEGGLNRNSSPQALATLRDTYDRFLLKFPLLFGYWKKYADLEFNISGPESAEMVSTLAYWTASTSADPAPDLRERMCQHHKFGRSLDRILLLQDGNHAYAASRARVSIDGVFPSQPMTTSPTASLQANQGCMPALETLHLQAALKRSDMVR